MKLLNETPRNMLIAEITQLVSENKTNDENLFNCINSMLDKYDIKFAELPHLVDIPPIELIGKNIIIEYTPASNPKTFRGVLLTILYRDIAYDMKVIKDILQNPIMSEEHKNMMSMTIYEETKPKVYHRLVLNDENEGILIIPLLKDITVIKEQE